MSVASLCGFAIRSEGKVVAKSGEDAVSVARGGVRVGVNGRVGVVGELEL
jgi:hypothetical protein